MTTLYLSPPNREAIIAGAGAPRRCKCCRERKTAGEFYSGRRVCIACYLARNAKRVERKRQKPSNAQRLLKWLA